MRQNKTTLFELVSDMYFKARNAGYTKAELDNFLAKEVLPMADASTQNAATKSATESESGRDFSKYKRDGFPEILNKRQIILTTIKYLVEIKKMRVEQINELGIRANYSRPILMKLDQIKGDLVNRYFIKVSQVLTAGGDRYAVVNQWGSKNFDSFSDVLAQFELAYIRKFQ